MYTLENHSIQAIEAFDKLSGGTWDNKTITVNTVDLKKFVEEYEQIIWNLQVVQFAVHNGGKNTSGFVAARYRMDIQIINLSTSEQSKVTLDEYDWKNLQNAYYVIKSIPYIKEEIINRVKKTTVFTWNMQDLEYFLERFQEINRRYQKDFP